MARVRKQNIFLKISVATLIVVFFSTCVIPSQAWAQVALLGLPKPGAMVPLSPSFHPALLRGIQIQPDNPLRFDFIVDTGDSGLEGEAFQAEASKLIKYFLASLTIPENDFWVNLSPYEKERIISDSLSQTEMGRDLLAEDYILKQLTATLVHPNSDLGKNFWDRVYKKAYEAYGTTQIPANTFNKIWIIPDQAVVYEEGNIAFVGDRHLKVMLEEDYLSMEQNANRKDLGTATFENEDMKKIAKVSSDVVREVLIPEIEKEVNNGTSFANLRQIFDAMILATWYKKTLRDSLLGQVYVDKAKTKGIDLEDKTIKQKIYEQYLETFKKGVVDLIKVEKDISTDKNIPRKYFSGGVSSNLLQTLIVQPLKKLGSKAQDLFSSYSKKGKVQQVTADFRDFNGEKIQSEPQKMQITVENLSEKIGQSTFSPGMNQLAETIQGHFEGASSQVDVTASTIVDLKDVANQVENRIRKIGSPLIQLQNLTQRIKNGEKGLEAQRVELAVQYVKDQLGEHNVDGNTIGNDEIVFIIETYIRDQERTDVQVLLLEGEYTDKVINVLRNISTMHSTSLAESLLKGVGATRKIEGTRTDFEALTPALKEKSKFYLAEEIALYKNQPEYWKTEENWIGERKKADPRWSQFEADGKTKKTSEQEESDAQSLLGYAREKLEPKLAAILEAFVQEAGLQGQFANISYRTKGVKSSLRKLNGLRGQSWAQGKDISLADLVDLLGGRIVVDDLKSLERIMLTVEDIIAKKQDDPRFKGMKILRKENKFIANDGKADPYRAVQYTITFPGEDGQQFTFELQLKTFSAMIASDLFHNVVYKKEVLNLPGDLQETVTNYNWQSDVEEAKAYLGAEASKVDIDPIKRAIEERDFNSFYDLVLSKIGVSTFKNKVEWIKTFDEVNQLLNKEIEFLKELRETRPDIIDALAKASHDNGYYFTNDVAGKDGKGGVINDPNSPWLNPELSEEAKALLTESGRNFYNNRYENFRGNNQKLTGRQLDLHNLSETDLAAFLKLSGKNMTTVNFDKPMINLYHQRFDALLEQGKNIQNEQARKKWNEAIVSNQMKAVAVSVLLTEIGGVDEQGQPRDLGKPVFEDAPFTLREKLIHEFWVFALQYDGEYAYDGLNRLGEGDPEGWRAADREGRATMNYREFVTAKDSDDNVKFANQYNLDRTIDEAVFEELVSIHLNTIANKIVENKDNSIKMASLQRAKSEIIAKYIKASVPNHQLAERITSYVDERMGQDSETLLRGNGGAKALREKLLSLASRENKKEAEQELAGAWQIQDQKTHQFAMEKLTTIFNLADFTPEDIKELSKAFISSTLLSRNDLIEISNSLSVVSDITKRLQDPEGQGIVLLGAGGSAKTEQLEMALGTLGKNHDSAGFNLRAEFLKGETDDAKWERYKTDPKMKSEELAWLKSHLSNIEENLINSKKGIVVLDEFDLAIGETLNVEEQETAKLIFDMAKRLQSQGIKVIFIVHAKGMNTAAFQDIMKSQGLLSKEVVKTAYLAAGVELKLLKAMGIENTKENNNAADRFLALTKGLPAAYLGFFKNIAGSLAESKSLSYQPSFVELIAQAYRVIESNYHVAQKTLDPIVIDLLQKIALGSLSLKDEKVLSLRGKLLETGLVGEREGIAGADLVMAPLVRDVINLAEANEKVQGLPAQYKDYQETSHYHPMYHFEGGKNATLRDHLLAQMAAFITAASDEKAPLAARKYLSGWKQKNLDLLKGFIELHDLGKMTRVAPWDDGSGYSFGGHELESFNILENNPISYGNLDANEMTVLKLVIKNHIAGFTMKGKEDIQKLANEFKEKGITGGAFLDAMELLIATTTLDLFSSQTDEFGNVPGQGVLIDNMIKALEDFKQDYAEMPINPKGTTGVEGKGELWYWDANYTADMVVTRTNPDTGKKEVLMDTIKKKIIGGFRNGNTKENIFSADLRETKEEASVDLKLLGITQDKATLIYSGYVNDPRNANNAWIETDAYHVDLSDEAVAQLSPEAGDDAESIEWKPLDEINSSEMYGDHGKLLNIVKENLAKGNFVKGVGSSKADLGGIDLNAANLNLQIKRDGKGMVLPLNQQSMEFQNIEGFTPFIINVTPFNPAAILSQMGETAPEVGAS